MSSALGMLFQYVVEMLAVVQGIGQNRVVIHAHCGLVNNAVVGNGHTIGPKGIKPWNMLETRKIASEINAANYVALGVKRHVFHANILKGSNFPILHIGEGGMIHADVRTDVVPNTDIHITVFADEEVADFLVFFHEFKA